MTKKEKEYTKSVMENINKLREYGIPQENSVKAEVFLKTIKENINSDNKCIIDKDYFLASLVQFKYISKKKDGGYVAKEEYINNGLLEVKECFIITKSIKKNYTVLLTTKGQEYFKEFVLKLIHLRSTP